MIKIFCDICGKEPDMEKDDFAFEATITEFMTSLVGQNMVPKKEMKREMIQICKGCFYTHISKLLKNGKK